MLKNKFLTLALATTVAALATAGSAQAATDYFLKVTPSPTTEPVVGETMDREFPGAIEIESFSFGAENTLSIGSASGGAGAGKAKFQEFTVEKAVDSTTPRFLRALATGGPFATVELIARTSGASGGSVTPVRTLFQMVAISKQEQSGSRGENMREKLTFAYGGIAQAVTSPKSPTKPDSFASWSVITNTPIKDALAAPYRA